MKLKNKTQVDLDVCKYFSSEKAKKDLSGAMTYCQLCPNEEEGYCRATQEQREKYGLCEREAVYFDNIDTSEKMLKSRK